MRDISYGRKNHLAAWKIGYIFREGKVYMVLNLEELSIESTIFFAYGIIISSSSFTKRSLAIENLKEICTWDLFPSQVNKKLSSTFNYVIFIK